MAVLPPLAAHAALPPGLVTPPRAAAHAHGGSAVGGAAAGAPRRERNASQSGTRFDASQHHVPNPTRRTGGQNSGMSGSTTGLSLPRWPPSAVAQPQHSPVAGASPSSAVAAAATAASAAAGAADVEPERVLRRSRTEDGHWVLRQASLPAPPGAGTAARPTAASASGMRPMGQSAAAAGAVSAHASTRRPTEAPSRVTEESFALSSAAASAGAAAAAVARHPGFSGSGFSGVLNPPSPSAAVATLRPTHNNHNVPSTQQGSCSPLVGSASARASTQQLAAKAAAAAAAIAPSRSPLLYPELGSGQATGQAVGYQGTGLDPGEPPLLAERPSPVLNVLPPLLEAREREGSISMRVGVGGSVVAEGSSQDVSASVMSGSIGASHRTVAMAPELGQPQPHSRPGSLRPASSDPPSPMSPHNNWAATSDSFPRNSNVSPFHHPGALNARGQLVSAQQPHHQYLAAPPVTLLASNSHGSSWSQLAALSSGARLRGPAALAAAAHAVLSGSPHAAPAGAADAAGAATTEAAAAAATSAVARARLQAVQGGGGALCSEGTQQLELLSLGGSTAPGSGATAAAVGGLAAALSVEGASGGYADFELPNSRFTLAAPYFHFGLTHCVMRAVTGSARDLYLPLRFASQVNRFSALWSMHPAYKQRSFFSPSRRAAEAPPTQTVPSAASCPPETPCAPGQTPSQPPLLPPPPPQQQPPQQPQQQHPPLPHPHPWPRVGMLRGPTGLPLPWCTLGLRRAACTWQRQTRPGLRPTGRHVVQRHALTQSAAKGALVAWSLE